MGAISSGIHIAWIYKKSHMVTGSAISVVHIARRIHALYGQADQHGRRDVGPGDSNAGSELSSSPMTQAGNLFGNLSGIDFTSTWTFPSTMTKPPLPT